MMVVKVLGAACVLAVCGGFGYYLAWQHSREETMLSQLLRTIEYMNCELLYRLTSLPNLCRQCADELSGTLSEVFLDLATELDAQVLPNVDHCMMAALDKRSDIPGNTRNMLIFLGKQLGKFDLNGQVSSLNTVKENCNRLLETISKEKELQLRRYKTLGLCAGAALIIIFI